MGIETSEILKERYLNSKRTIKERVRAIHRDFKRRNQRAIPLWNERNIRIFGYVQYNPFTGNLSLSWGIKGNNGKRLLSITDALNKKTKKSDKLTIIFSTLTTGWGRVTHVGILGHIKEIPEKVK